MDKTTLLQTETDILSNVAQQGIAFAILVVVVLVMGRIIWILWKKNESLINERRESEKEMILIIKDATDAMKTVSKHIENGNI